MAAAAGDLIMAGGTEAGVCAVSLISSCVISCGSPSRDTLDSYLRTHSTELTVLRGGDDSLGGHG